MTYASRRNIARRQKVLTLKEQLREAVAEAGYYKGLALGLAAELEATKRERPADLEDWIASIQGDLSEAEKAAWDELTDEDREAFVDQLGQRISTQERLLATAPEASPTGSPA